MHCSVSGSLLRLTRSSGEVVRNRPVRDRRRFLRRRLRRWQRGRKFFVCLSSCRRVRDRDGRSSRGSRQSEPVGQRVLFNVWKDQVHKSILSNSEGELYGTTKRWRQMIAPPSHQESAHPSICRYNWPRSAGARRIGYWSSSSRKNLGTAVIEISAGLRFIPLRASQQLSKPLLLNAQTCLRRNERGRKAALPKSVPPRHAPHPDPSAKMYELS